MYDKGKVVLGMAVFLLLALSPVLYNGVMGQASVAPELMYPDPAVATTCIESKDFMRANHMQVLIDWRDTVVRGGDRIYRASDGQEYNMSLTNECMTCHTDKAKFCDQCHNYLKVKPYCWDCHVIPKENA